MLWGILSGERSNNLEVEYRDRLADVVEFGLALELARFTNTMAPWESDSITQVYVLHHLPRLDELLRHDVNCEVSMESVEGVTKIRATITLLADSFPDSWPLIMTFTTRRKHIWSELKLRIDK